jgi:hypothetical protein
MRYTIEYRKTHADGFSHTRLVVDSPVLKEKIDEIFGHGEEIYIDYITVRKFVEKKAPAAKLGGLK